MYAYKVTLTFDSDRKDIVYFAHGDSAGNVLTAERGRYGHACADVRVEETGIRVRTEDGSYV